MSLTRHCYGHLRWNKVEIVSLFQLCNLWNHYVKCRMLSQHVTFRLNGNYFTCTSLDVVVRPITCLLLILCIMFSMPSLIPLGRVFSYRCLPHIVFSNCVSVFSCLVKLFRLCLSTSTFHSFRMFSYIQLVTNIRKGDHFNPFLYHLSCKLTGICIFSFLELHSM